MASATLPLPPPSEPMLELNTTPLIDIMLVLLIMFIITIPPQSHAVKLDVTSGEHVNVDPLRNKVVVTEAGALLFNGEPVTRPALSALFEEMAQAAVQPELQIQPAATAPYGVVDDVLVRAKKAQLTRLGFVGNEAYQRF